MVRWRPADTQRERADERHDLYGQLCAAVADDEQRTKFAYIAMADVGCAVLSVEHNQPRTADNVVTDHERPCYECRKLAAESLCHKRKPFLPLATPVGSVFEASRRDKTRIAAGGTHGVRRQDCATPTGSKVFSQQTVGFTHGYSRNVPSGLRGQR